MKTNSYKISDDKGRNWVANQNWRPEEKYSRKQITLITQFGKQCTNQKVN